MEKNLLGRSIFSFFFFLFFVFWVFSITNQSHTHTHKIYKKNKQKAVVLLPFIDEERLLSALEPLEKTLSANQQRMNGEGFAEIYVNYNHPMGNEMNTFNQKQTKNQNDSVL